MNSKYRADIDGLRAVAVTSVVAYHASPALVRGGFIGVDIFFVISGYLISTIILENLQRDRFSFLDFYTRRIRRIFPALILILGCCLLAGWCWLLANEYGQLGKHVAAGAGFVSNLMLWRESGYFDGGAVTKPLLHLWSLGIEEQFYLLWPLLLWVCWRIRVNPLLAILAVGVLSFGLNIGEAFSNRVADFYSPQTRFWELSCGGCLACLMIFPHPAFERLRARSTDIQAITGCLLLVGGLLLISNARPYPGWWALLPAAGTVLMLSAGPESWLARRVLSNRVFVWVGLISYPLYLWHWPLLVFARVAGNSGADLPRWVRLLIVGLSVLLAWATYEFIERPVRFRPRSKTTTLVLLAAMTGCGLLGWQVAAHNGLESRSPAFRRADLEFLNSHQFPEAENCRLSLFSLAEAPDKCSANTDQPEVALIGDSHAGHYYKALTASRLKAAVIWNGGCYPGASLERCESKERALEAFIAHRAPSLRLVLLSAYLNVYLNPRDASGAPNGTYAEMRQQVGVSAGEDAVAQLIYTDYARLIGKLRAQGLNVGILADVPELLRPVIGCRTTHDCDRAPQTANVLSSQRGARQLLARLQGQFPGLALFDPVPLLCDSRTCHSEVGGKLLYSDDNHLNENGSYFVGGQLVSWIESSYPLSPSQPPSP
jgi:peptidoglycan/LPS O-acetylase OafA/YrhL